MTIIGILPLNKRNLMVNNFYKKQFQIYTKTLCKTHFNIKVKIINNFNENFEKPAIIVCNHQSLFDVPLTLSYFNNIFIVTNNWHNKSSIKYLIEKFVDFLPVTNGMDWLANKATCRINNNVCGLFFPEYNRVNENKIQRYHNGAFLLASKLDVDIIPVIIRASKNIMSKSLYFFKNGNVTMFIGERIACSNQTSSSIKQQATDVCSYSRKIYSEINNVN